MGRLLILTILVTAACSRSRPRESELPALEAPLFAGKSAEVNYLFSQTIRYIRSMAVEDDMNFDSRKHVDIQFYFMMQDFARWRDREPPADDESVRRELSSTPEIFLYRGARQNAVALGLVAYSIWRRDPKRQSLSIEQLDICGRHNSGRPCGVEPRTLTLQRMMLVAEYADGALYESLRHKLPPVHVQRTRYVPAAPVPDSTPESTP